MGCSFCLIKLCKGNIGRKNCCLSEYLLLPLKSIDLDGKAHNEASHQGLHFSVKVFVYWFQVYEGLMDFAELRQSILLNKNKLKYSKICVKGPLSKRPKLVFKTQCLLNAGQTYCRMQGEHSAIPSFFIKIPLVIKTFVLSILSGRVTQVLLYYILHVVMDIPIRLN